MRRPSGRSPSFLQGRLERSRLHGANVTALDPISWISSERWIRCPDRWQRTRKRRPRRQFADDFKAQAVRLALDEGKSVGASPATLI